MQTVDRLHGAEKQLVRRATEYHNAVKQGNTTKSAHIAEQLVDGFARLSGETVLAEDKKLNRLYERIIRRGAGFVSCARTTKGLTALTAYLGFTTLVMRSHAVAATSSDVRGGDTAPAAETIAAVSKALGLS